jgi:hypothetical protein
VLDAARSYGEGKLPGRRVDVEEFGVPSVGLDETETHFVSIEAEGIRLLARVTISPDGAVCVAPLTAS